MERKFFKIVIIAMLLVCVWETIVSALSFSVTMTPSKKVVPASTELSGGKDYDGSGRTITFPVQNTYTDGYVKFKLCSQGGNTFAGYMILSVYKIGETNKNNFVIWVKQNVIIYC